ncbi:MAG: cobyric acid synthase [Candidatus Omnitrophota bacterium]
MAKTIMICGTGSNVGKSVITAGLCRILKKDGFRVAPFKSQNMALNSYATKDGGEMGMAQAIQAFAAGIEPHVDMNPILIKPSSGVGAQVTLLGKVKGNMDGRAYGAFKKDGFNEAKKAFGRLSKMYDVIVMEGAGSPSEINIPEDIVNMPMAKTAKAPVLLVGDIDLGGVFAWFTGTLALLKPSYRRMVKGFIINKFRGSLDVLKPGLSLLEKKTKRPVLGVVPYFNNIRIGDEDSVEVNRREDVSVKWPTPGKKVAIEILLPPHASNLTDFDPLVNEAEVSVRFVKMGEAIGDPDLLILPGTKNTIQDIQFLKREGYIDSIKRALKKGSLILGICGCFQMLGKKVIDIKGSESGLSKCEGLSLFNIVTRIMPSKVTSQVEFEALGDTLPGSNKKGLCALKGFEIHLGRTKYLKGSKPLFKITKRGNREVEITDGAVNEDGNAFGTYIHGLFDNDTLRNTILNMVRAEKGLSKRSVSKQNRNNELNKLEGLLRKHLDLKKIYDIIGIKKMKRGLVHIYTGEGKGKTTAALGLATRALGWGRRVCVFQFLKKGKNGEYKTAKLFGGRFKCVTFDQTHPMFLPKRSRKKASMALRKKVLADMVAVNKAVLSGKYDIVILDEIINTLKEGYIGKEAVLSLIDNRSRASELILTGRGAAAWLLKKADYVTDMRLVKHPYKKGVLARKGIEY